MPTEPARGPPAPRSASAQEPRKSESGRHGSTGIQNSPDARSWRYFQRACSHIIRSTATDTRRTGDRFPLGDHVLRALRGVGRRLRLKRLVDFAQLARLSDRSIQRYKSVHPLETSKKVSEVFDKAMQNAPSVLVIDEMELSLPIARWGQVITASRRSPSS